MRPRAIVGSGRAEAISQASALTRKFDVFSQSLKPAVTAFRKKSILSCHFRPGLSHFRQIAFIRQEHFIIPAGDAHMSRVRRRVMPFAGIDEYSVHISET
jgi:hypothetical protein